MTDIQKLLQFVQPEIDEINRTITKDLDALTGDLDDLLVEILSYGLLGGGKRFRPLLAVIAARMCGDQGTDVYRLAIAFEYLHMATLIHDDVIDNAHNRRGKPSVYRAFGLPAAILAGDFLHARSMAIVGDLGGSKALDIFCEATGGMVDGEFLQMRNANNHNQSESDYFHAINGKTALLIAATTEIGALYGGGSDAKQQALRRYGVYLGSAFQIVDDLLDYLGDEAKTGKPVGNDLVEGKMTLPLIVSLNASDKKDKKRLIAILENDDKRARGYNEVKTIIDKYDGFQYSRKKAEEHVGMAVEALMIFSGTDTERETEILKGLAQYVLKREK